MNRARRLARRLMGSLPVEEPAYYDLVMAATRTFHHVVAELAATQPRHLRSDKRWPVPEDRDARRHSPFSVLIDRDLFFRMPQHGRSAATRARSAADGGRR